jgi:glycosyltransferase involved in cell wall biosynthesis
VTLAVSIIIPTYNRGKLLNRCVDSVLNACMDQDEIIIVDGASNNDAEVLINRYDHSQLNYVSMKNAGVSAARNYGLGIAKNDLIAYIDDDDEWHPSKLNIQRKLLEKHPLAVGCFTNILATNANGEKQPNFLFQWGQPVQGWNQLLGEKRTYVADRHAVEIDYYYGDHYFNQMLDDYVLPSSLLIDRSKFHEPLIYRVGMQRNESWLYTSQVCRQGPVIYVDFDLTCHHGDSLNRLTAVPQIETVLSRLYVLEHEFGKQSDFSQKNQVMFNQRLSRELDVLFGAVMSAGIANRRQIFRDNAYHGGKIAFAAKIPEPLLSVFSGAFRAARRLRRFMTKRS